MSYLDQHAYAFGKSMPPIATICHGDFADARAAHPKLRLERTKTLMEGHDCCNHRWVFEG